MGSRGKSVRALRCREATWAGREKLASVEGPRREVISCCSYHRPRHAKTALASRLPTSQSLTAVPDLRPLVRRKGAACNMPDRFMNTGLWRRSLGLVLLSVADQRSVERLRNAYLKLREHAKVLTEHIRKSVPRLTVHDITHLDALWELADLIAGPDYPVNPLEGFVLGGAILLHDSALCFEAYEGGQAGLRNSTIWKDAYASISRDREDRSADEINRLADFAALRSLHAARASELGTGYWETSGKDRLYLIDALIFERSTVP